MMMEKEIIINQRISSSGSLFYRFDNIMSSNNDKLSEKTKHYRNSKCKVCNDLLNERYTYIIGKLIEAGLLKKNYRKLCCYCYDREKRAFYLQSRKKLRI